MTEKIKDSFLGPLVARYVSVPHFFRAVVFVYFQCYFFFLLAEGDALLFVTLEKAEKHEDFRVIFENIASCSLRVPRRQRALKGSK